MAAKRKSERLFVGILVLLAGILLGAGIIPVSYTHLLIPDLDNANVGNVQKEQQPFSF